MSEQELEQKLRDLIGPESEAERHRRVLDLIFENERLRETLREIRDLPTEHDLLFNAEAKALSYIAREALEGK